MRRNFILDSVLLFVSVILLVTGGVLWGNTCRCGRAQVQLATDDECRPLRQLHRCASVGFLAGLLLHLTWHWEWIRDNTPKVLHGEE